MPSRVQGHSIEIDPLNFAVPPATVMLNAASVMPLSDEKSRASLSLSQTRRRLPKDPRQATAPEFEKVSLDYPIADHASRAGTKRQEMKLLPTDAGFVWIVSAASGYVLAC